MDIDLENLAKKIAQMKSDNANISDVRLFALFYDEIEQHLGYSKTKVFAELLRNNGLSNISRKHLSAIRSTLKKSKIKTTKNKTDIPTREKSTNQQNQPEQNKEKPKQQSFKLKDLQAESEAIARKALSKPSPMIQRMMERERQSKLDEEELRTKNENSSN